jgi:hypothetical protein
LAADRSELDNPGGMSLDPVAQLNSVIRVTVEAAETTRGRYEREPASGARAGSEAAAELAEQACFAVRDDNMPVLDAYTTAFLGLTAATDELRCVHDLGPTRSRSTALPLCSAPCWRYLLARGGR